MLPLLTENGQNGQTAIIVLPRRVGCCLFFLSILSVLGLKLSLNVSVEKHCCIFQVDCRATQDLEVRNVGSFPISLKFATLQCYKTISL